MVTKICDFQLNGRVEFCEICYNIEIFRRTYISLYSCISFTRFIRIRKILFSRQKQPKDYKYTVFGGNKIPIRDTQKLILHKLPIQRDRYPQLHSKCLLIGVSPPVGVRGRETHNADRQWGCGKHLKETRPGCFRSATQGSEEVPPEKDWQQGLTANGLNHSETGE